MIISAYVDDFMVIALTSSAIDTIACQLALDLDLKDMGEMSQFIGIEISRSDDGIRISHSAKIASVCHDLGLSDYRGASAPITDDGLIDRPAGLLSDADATRFRSAVGSLLHIAIMTRPDIQYAVNRLARHVKSPSENAMLGLKHLVRYLSKTRRATLLFPISGASVLTGSSDSS